MAPLSTRRAKNPLSGVIAFYEAEIRLRGLIWGSIDCIHFSLHASHAAGNKDLRSLLPAYSSQRGALRSLRAAGYATIIEALDAHATPIACAQSRPGDIAYEDIAPMGALGVVIDETALFLGVDGMTRLPVAGRWIWRP